MRLLPVLLLLGYPVLTLPAGDMEFDRFFTDKKTRMQLDQAREQYKFISPRGNASAEDSQELVLPEVKVDGIIIRGDGSTEVWVNSATPGGNGLGDNVERSARRTKDGRVRLTLPSGKTVDLKPGQVYSMETEHIREAYEGVQETAPAGNKIEEKSSSPEVSEKDQPGDSRESAFNESTLAKDPDAKIKLLEERIQRLESSSGGGN
jgi:hypothetical protein